MEYSSQSNAPGFRSHIYTQNYNILQDQPGYHAFLNNVMTLYLLFDEKHGQILQKRHQIRCQTYPPSFSKARFF